MELDSKFDFEAKLSEFSEWIKDWYKKVLSLRVNADKFCEFIRKKFFQLGNFLT